MCHTKMIDETMTVDVVSVANDGKDAIDGAHAAALLPMVTHLSCLVIRKLLTRLFGHQISLHLVMTDVSCLSVFFGSLAR